MSTPKTRPIDVAIEAIATKSNAEYNAYMHGLCNGLLLARAIIDNQPASNAKDLFFPTPEVYYVDRGPPEPSKPPENWQQLHSLAVEADTSRNKTDDEDECGYY